MLCTQQSRVVYFSSFDTCCPCSQAWKLVIKDKKKLDGVEPTTLAVAAQKAQAEGFKNATADNGPWVITPDYATYASIVAFARDRDLRQQVYTAYRSLASSGKTNNTPLIRKILTLRRELAQLLGYPNYAVSAMAGRVSLMWAAIYFACPVAQGGEAAVE